ncbi:MAG TPA: PilZ domain-containing protein [Terriglobales bacterium]|nr:PilZ domain-containing protein [Terriglobales bacterium]
MATFMDKPLVSAWSPIPTTRKTSVRVALVATNEPASAILTECFRQFGMEPITLESHPSVRLQREKFAACVVPLMPGAESVMEAARLSASNSRIVIYGLGGSAQDALRFSKFGVNAVFHEPLERSSALKLVRATQTLLLHEFRRYVRIPVITEVAVVVGDGRRFSATSLEVSSGGMSLRVSEEVDPGQPVEISFALLTLPRIWVRGTVSWRKPALKTMGVRFDTHDERRLRIKEWVDAYFEN